MNKNCYIAGKIGGLPEVEYTHYFEQAKKEVKNMDLVPISPLDLPHKHGRTWEEYMKEDIIAMMKCSCVYALRNWRHSPGATIEVELALKLGINIIHQK